VSSGRPAAPFCSAKKRRAAANSLLARQASTATPRRTGSSRHPAAEAGIGTQQIDVKRVAETRLESQNRQPVPHEPALSQHRHHPEAAREIEFAGLKGPARQPQQGRQFGIYIQVWAFDPELGRSWGRTLRTCWRRSPAPTLSALAIDSACSVSASDQGWNSTPPTGACRPRVSEAAFSSGDFSSLDIAACVSAQNKSKPATAQAARRCHCGDFASKKIRAKKPRQK